MSESHLSLDLAPNERASGSSAQQIAITITRRNLGFKLDLSAEGDF